MNCGACGGKSVDDIRRVMHMVAELHRLGYQRLRLVPARAPVGWWRGNVSAVSNVLRTHGARARGYSGDLIARHSAAQRATVFGWEDATDDTPAVLALKFVERFPSIAAAGQGKDKPYADWYLWMLELTAPRGTFYAQGPWDIPDDCLPTLRVPGGIVIPLPPPGEAD
jgi:hypothetical protein